MIKTNNKSILTGEISPEYIRTHINELEDETYKILTKAKPKTITISRLSEEGWFTPIAIFDIREHVSGSSFEPELFEVEIE